MVLSGAKRPPDDAPKFAIQRKLDSGDIYDLFLGVFDGPARKRDPAPGKANRYDALMGDDDDPITGEPALLRVVRALNNADLAANEQKALGLLVTKDDDPLDGFCRFVPRLLTDPFTVNDRAAHVVPFFEEFLTLQEILTAYPKGIDFRDMVWMYKRALSGLGYAHTRGVIHGAVIPPHIMVHPTGHGAKVIDWCYSVSDSKTSVRAFAPAFKNYYAPEIFDRRFPTPGTDLYMLAKCMVALVGGSIVDNSMPDTVPKEVQSFLRRSLRTSVSVRPYDAWNLHEEFDALLLKLVGKPKYRPFAMPAAS